MTAKRTLFAAFIIASLLIVYLVKRPQPDTESRHTDGSASIKQQNPETPPETMRLPSASGTVRPPQPEEAVPQPTASPAIAASPEIAAPPGVTMLPVAETTRQLHSLEIEPQEDLHIIEGLIEFYRRIYNENPVAGVNEDVVEALIGYNAKKVGLIPDNHPAIDERGRLIDRWGTPYIFHAISGKHMQIVSAGPDLKTGTADDLYIE